MKPFFYKKNNERGAIVVEATVALAVFIFAIFTLLSVVNICYIQARIGSGLASSTKEISQYSYLYYKLGLNEAQPKMNDKNVESRATTKDTIEGVGVLMNSLSTGTESVETGDFKALIDSANTGKEEVKSLTSLYKEQLSGPKKFILGMASLAGEELLEEGKNKLGQLMCYSFMQKNLVESPTDDANRFDATEESIKKAVFSFCSKDQFRTSLVKLIEGEARTIISEKEQQDVLGIREHLSEEVIIRVAEKVTLWGYQLLDLQVTDITFSAQINKSMEQVVEAANKKKSAENEGLALLIQETKKAEAEGKAQVIKATSEKESWKLKGEGIALFREEVAKGLLNSAKMLKAEGIDEGLLSQVIYTEMLKDVAEKGQGKIIFLDGGAGASQRMVQEFSALNSLNTEIQTETIMSSIAGEEIE